MSPHTHRARTTKVNNSPAKMVQGITVRECLDVFERQGRAELLSALKAAGMSRHADRQKMASAIGRQGKRKGIQRPLLSLEWAEAQELIDHCLAEQSGSAPGDEQDAAAIQQLEPLGQTPSLPGEATGKAKPMARVRLITLYGAQSNAAEFDKWQREAPPWLEVRNYELPGHGSRTSEGVWSLGLQRAQAAHEAASSLRDAIDAEQERAVTLMIEEMRPLLTGCYAFYAFSMGAHLTYLLVRELERRLRVKPTAPAATPALALPFRLFVCGRHAPHYMHAGLAYWRSLWSAEDAEVLVMFHKGMGIPLEPDPALAGLKGRLWRADILSTSVHVGEPKVPTDHVLNEFEPWGKEPAVDPFQEPIPHAANPPLLGACPLIVLASATDKVWPFQLMRRWAEVAGEHGCRIEEPATCTHFSLMTHQHCVRTVTAGLFAAARAQAGSAQPLPEALCDVSGAREAPHGAAGGDSAHASPPSGVPSPAPSGVPSGVPPGVPTPDGASGPELATCASLLGALGLGGFLAALAEEGYDDLDTLQALGEAELLDVLSTDCQMPEPDARRVMARVQDHRK